MSSLFLEAVHADPWGENFVDLQSLNVKAGDAVEESVHRIRDKARSEPRALRSTSIVVLGPPGAGKTHLFVRLRRRLGPRAVFVHIRPLVHAPMSLRFVLGEVVRQLGYATHGFHQLDALVGSLLAHLSGSVTAFSSTFLSLYQQCDELEREAKLDGAVEKVVGIWQETDERFLRKLLQASFATGATQRALLAWLSGRDCDLAQLSRIGLSASLPEELALPALGTLCSVAALGAPIVLVMDQLENLIDGPEPGPRLFGYANLAAELVDSMRGLVLVHMALDTEWARGIEPALNLAQRTRLLMRRETLALPTAREREDLLRLWIDQLPERAGPYPWPFNDEGLARVLQAPGMTPRMLMIECRRALHQEGPETELESEHPHETDDASSAGLMAEWESCLGAGRQVVSEAAEHRGCVDPERLVDGLLACSHFLVEASISTSKASSPVQLLLERSGGNWQIALFHHGHHRSLGSALDKLSTLTTRAAVIALRERAWDLPPTWKNTLAKRSALLATGRARWIWIEPDDVVRLLGLDALLQATRSGDVTNERGKPVDVSSVIDWVRTTLNVPEWGIVKALLGDPQGIEDSDPDERSETSAAGSTIGGAQPKTGVGIAVLRQLHIASVERLVRDAGRIDPSVTRAAVLLELEGHPSVRFFGRSIVCVRAER